MPDAIPIDIISPPSNDEFYRQYVAGNRPVVLRGAINDWPALKLWTFRYFMENFGNVDANAARVKDGKGYINVEEGIKFKSFSLKEALARVEDGKLEESWTISTPVSLLPKSLLKDYTAPRYCAGGKFLTSLVFLGASGLATPLHQDLQENLYTTIKGRKRITLFAPSAPVYPYSRFSKLPNFSQVDLGYPDYRRFPRLAKAQPYSAELSAGEILYIPSFWWHYIQNLEPSVAMNFWWAAGWRVPIVWAGIMYGRLRSLGNHSDVNK